MIFEKTDAKQAERVHGSADMDFVFASKLQTVRESGPEKPGPLQKLTGLCIARDCFTTLGKSQDRKNPGPLQKLTGLCIARDCFTTLGKSQLNRVAFHAHSLSNEYLNELNLLAS